MKKILGVLLALVLAITLMSTAAMADAAAAASAAAEVVETDTADAGALEADVPAAETLEADAPEAEVTIFVTRHGKTLFNTLGRVQGWSDSPLTEAGIETVENLGIGLKTSGITFDSAYSSDLGRQRDTARIVLDQMGLTDMPVKENRGLREVCFGSWEGELNNVFNDTFCEITGIEDASEIFADQDLLLQIFVDTDETGLAENLPEATDRFVGALSEIAEEAKANGESNVLVVTSGEIINTLLLYLNESSRYIENASVTMLYYNNGEFTLGAIGDVTYSDIGAKSKEGESE